MSVPAWPRRRRLLAGPLVLAGVGLVLASPAFAQDPPAGGRGSHDRAHMEERIRAQMDRMVRERLALNDEEVERLSEIVKRFHGERRALGRSERATRRRVEALLREGAEGQAGEAAQLLDRMVEIRARESELFAQEQAALREVLTPAQVIQLLGIREEIGRRIRALRRDRHDRPGARSSGNEGWVAERGRSQRPRER